MRILIMTDLEGVAGVAAFKQVEGGFANPFYVQARALLAGEINAAVAGAREAGAEDILILDGHGSGYDLAIDLERIEDADVRFLLGAGGPDLLTEALSGKWDASVMIGQHAREGSGGVLEHSWAGGTIVRGRLGDVEIGEIGLWAAATGEQGAPLAAVSGDDAAAREAEGVGARGIAVKRAVGRHYANSLHPRRAREKIREGVREALLALPELCPWKPGPPWVFTVEYSTAQVASKYQSLPGMSLADDRTVVVRAESAAELLRQWFLMNRIV